MELFIIPAWIVYMAGGAETVALMLMVLSRICNRYDGLGVFL